MKNVLITIFIVSMLTTAALFAGTGVPAMAWADWSMLRLQPCFYAVLGCILTALASSVLYFKNSEGTRCGVALLCSLLIHGLIFTYLNTVHVGTLDFPTDRQVTLNIQKSPVTVKDYTYYWDYVEAQEDEAGDSKAPLMPSVTPVLDTVSEMETPLFPEKSWGSPISTDETDTAAREIEAASPALDVGDLTTDENWQNTAPEVPVRDPEKMVPQELARPEGSTLTVEESLPETRDKIAAVEAPDVKKIDLREADSRAQVPARTAVKPAEPLPGKLLPGEQQQWGEMVLDGTPEGTSHSQEKVLAGTGEEDLSAGTQYTVANRNDTDAKKEGVTPRKDARLAQGGQSTGAVAQRDEKERKHLDYLSGAVNGVSDRVLEDVTKVQEISGSNLPGEAQREQLLSDVATAKFVDAPAFELGNLPLDDSESPPMSDEEWKKEMETILADRVIPAAEEGGDAVAIIAAPEPSFRQRRRAGHRAAIEEAGGNPEAEVMVERGLEFMDRTQFADGHWSFDHFPGTVPSREVADKMKGTMNSDTAATGLGLLVFLGSGYTHFPDPQNPTDYHEIVNRGIEWLKANQQPDGALFSQKYDLDRYARIYAHGIATIALCEAYGMTKDPNLQEPAQRAVNFIVDAQSRQGGWRYTPQKQGDPWNGETDTSVSGWQLMALVSARHAGLKVPDSTLVNVTHWINTASIDGGARFCYFPIRNPTNEEQQGWRTPSPAMTAEGLLMELYLGYRVDSPEFQQGVDYLAQNLPSWDKGLRDTYYWYYATQVMYHVRGPRWEEWQNQLFNHLQANQDKTDPYLAGSWDPSQDKWGAIGGRHYITAMHLLALEVYYRHLPLFKSLRSNEVVENK